jgi:hypothetical protein
MRSPERDASKRGQKLLNLDIQCCAIRYQAAHSEDTADWEDIAHALVKCKLRELAIAL